MEVELTRACNFRCAYCPLEEKTASAAELSGAEIRDVIVQAKELGARRIVLVGGEPTLRRDLLELIRFVTARDLEVEMFTNGAGISAGVAGQLFAERVRVVLKMDSLDEHTQDRLTRTQGSFGLIQRAFRQLKDAGYPSNEAFLAVGAVVCRENVDEMARLWRWLRDQGVAPFLQALSPRGCASEGQEMQVEPARLRDLFHELSQIDREQYARSWEPQPPLPGGPCHQRGFGCRICAQGDVVACVGLSLRLGNIRQGRLADIIEASEVLEDLRDHRRLLKGPCRSCERAGACYGCRGSAYHLTGDYLASDPACWRNAERQDEIARLPFPAAGIVPHGLPMRLVDAVVCIGERSGVVSARVSEQMPFANADGALSEVAYLELMAQSIAALDGFKQMGAARAPTGGYVVGVRKLEILGTARVGDGLRVLVQKSGRFGKFGVVSCCVLRGHTLLARGEIRVWLAQPEGVEAAAESG